MDETIRSRFNQHVLAAVAARYQLAPADLKALPAAESFIFEFQRESERYILRLSHSLRRSVALIRGEIDWLNYLAAGGISVAAAVASPGGELVETIPDEAGGCFLATAFLRATGQPPHEVGWSDELHWRYGRLLGRLHARTKSYRPAPGCVRPGWDHESLELVERYLPASEELALRHYRDLHQQRHQLAQSRDAFGLIHQDAHGGNFLVDEAGVITLFDFDDCLYSWFANDIAMALFYRLVGAAEPEALALSFLPPFLDGYRSANDLDPSWLATIPIFLKAREIELFAIMYREYGDLEQIEFWWDKQFMTGRRERIDQNLPFVAIDFAALAR